MELVDAIGHVPLPPYIKRPDTAADRERYQTMFARARVGGRADRRAALHAGDARRPGRSRRRAPPVTLHVGYGTFKPVRVERVEDHVVDPEPYEISDAAAAAINGARRSTPRDRRRHDDHARARRRGSGGGGTRPPGGPLPTLFIHPGFEFQVIDGLMTNFHLPRSSLLMLVAAFAGRERVLPPIASAVASATGSTATGTRCSS